MLISYLVLGVSPDASDDDVRNTYLQLVKKYPPEKDTFRFQKITAAYESIKNKRLRIQGKLFGGLMAHDSEIALLALIKAYKISRRRVGLKELFQAEHNMMNDK